jgi:hypothetical protein
MAQWIKVVIITVGRLLNLVIFAGAGATLLSGGITVGFLTAWNNLPEGTRTDPDGDALLAVALVVLFFLLGLLPLFERWNNLRQKVDDSLASKPVNGSQIHVATTEQQSHVLRHRIWGGDRIGVYVGLEFGVEESSHRGIKR